MTSKRKRYSAQFKAKVALEALRGELTTAQLATKHGIHPTMVGEWKKQAMEGLTAVFADRSRPRRQRNRLRLRLTGCTRRSANWWWNGIFWPKPPVDEHRAEATDD
jgi:transposase